MQLLSTLQILLIHYFRWNLNNEETLDSASFPCNHVIAYCHISHYRVYLQINSILQIQVIYVEFQLLFLIIYKKETCFVWNTCTGFAFAVELIFFYSCSQVNIRNIHIKVILHAYTDTHICMYTCYIISRFVYQYDHLSIYYWYSSGRKQQYLFLKDLSFIPLYLLEAIHSLAAMFIFFWNLNHCGWFLFQIL